MPWGGLRQAAGQLRPRAASGCSQPTLGTLASVQKELRSPKPVPALLPACLSLTHPAPFTGAPRTQAGGTASTRCTRGRHKAGGHPGAEQHACLPQGDGNWGSPSLPPSQKSPARPERAPSGWGAPKFGLQGPGPGAIPRRCGWVAPAAAWGGSGERAGSPPSL